MHSTATPSCDLTILVPAYNEADSIRDTVESLLNQTLAAAEIIVIDDGSTDDTGDIARSMGVTVMRPEKGTGSKAGAQNFALKEVTTHYVMAIDADTTLAPDAVEKIMAPMNDPAVAAACGFVLPRYVRSVWERGRYIEYLFAFSFYKTIQDYYGKPLIASGCFSVYQTEILKRHKGWQERTRAEDMDLTWSFYMDGLKVRFVPEAVSYPIEPHNFNFMRVQLTRWSHGFVQNLQLHWRGLLNMPVLRNIVTVAAFDSLVASFAYLFILPLLAIFVNPLFLLAYVIDLPVVAVPVLYRAKQRGEFWKAFASLPSYVVLRVVNCWFILKAFFDELVMRKPLLVFEKGH